jgi:threonine dehydrogenase-like Zn-dependent dehydrogenase
MLDAYPRDIELVASGQVDVASIVTDRIDLAAAPDMFRSLADGAPGLGKVLIYPDRK